MAKKDDCIVGLDVGTKKVCAVVGKVDENNEIEIVGVGTSDSQGLYMGSVVNLQKTQSSIKEAIRNAEIMSAVDIDSAWVGISGNHIRSFNSRGVVAISGKDREISYDDINRVVEAAKALSVPPDIEIIQFLPQEFIVDNQAGIRDPLGMTGIRLEVNVHIITNLITSTTNLLKCVNEAEIEVKGLVLNSVASSDATLTEDEKELGVALLDIGAGITDCAIFDRGSLWHTFVLPVGGNHFTNDIAIGLRTPIPEAEKIKRRWGCPIAISEEDESIEIPKVGGGKPRVLSRRILCDIIQPRAEEIFKLVLSEIKKMGLEKSLNTGVVITGGCSLLEGIIEIAEEVFDLPVRRGTPIGVKGLYESVNLPEFATSVGLILYGNSITKRKEIIKAGIFEKFKEFIGIKKNKNK
ncbi:MAG: cell division protein FtsA [Acidobacteriota bacterium]